jgi:hypothetical protein
MEHFKMNKFEEANNISIAIERIENTVISSFKGTPESVTNYITEILTNTRPYIMFTPEELSKVWTTARNRDQDIIDWIIDTYRRIVLDTCSKDILDSVRDVYADSLFIGDVTTLYGDEDLGSRLPNKERVNEILKEHRWSVVLMALYAIDLSDIGVGNEKN